MTVKKAIGICEMPGGFTITSPKDIEEFHAKWRMLVENARRNNDDEKAKVLSEAWAIVKKRQSMYCECGARKYRDTNRCPQCGIEYRAARNHAIPPWTVGVVEDGVFVTNRGGDGEIVPLLRQLEKVGQSIVIGAGDSTIRNSLRKLNMKGRIIPLGKFSDKTYFRVWRTDGLSTQEVNEQIKARQSGG